MAVISLPQVLLLAITGEQLVPSKCVQAKASVVLMAQGAIYMLIGTAMFLFPQQVNTSVFMGTLTEAENPLYSFLGLLFIAAGFYFVTTARMNDMYFTLLTIFNRTLVTPILWITLYLVFGGSAELCLPFVALELVFAFVAYVTMKNEMHNPELSFLTDLKLAITGKGLLPHFICLGKHAKVSMLQGVVYVGAGLLLFTSPSTCNKIMFMREPFTEEQTVLYRALGINVIGMIGIYYIMTPRMNHIYFATVIVLSRLTFVPLMMITAIYKYQDPLQLSILVLIIDPIFAYWTYSTLKTKLKVA